MCHRSKKKGRDRDRETDPDTEAAQTLCRAWDCVGAVGAVFLEESSTIERRELRLHHPKNEEVNQNHPQGTMVKAPTNQKEVRN